MLAFLPFLILFIALVAGLSRLIAGQPEPHVRYSRRGGPSEPILLRKIHGVAVALRGIVVLPMGFKRPSVTLMHAVKAFALACALFLVMPVGKAAALTLPAFSGIFTASERLELSYSENNTVDVKINRGRLLDSLVINLPWTSTVTADATAVRTRGAPIKTIQLLGDGGKVHLSIKLQDAIRKAEVYGRASLTQLLTSPSGVTAAGSPYTGRLKLPIYIASRHAYTPWLTALGTWRMTKDPVLRIQFGSHAEVYRGGTGSTAVTSGDAFIEQVSSVDFADIIPEAFGGDPDAFADALPFAVDSYEEKTYTAAQDRLTFDLPVTQDYRAIMVTVEDTNSDPLSETEMAKISFTLKENGSVDVDSEVNLGSLRARNTEQFNFPSGIAPGVAIREWADDRDITSIYKASQKNKVQLVFKTATPAAGTYTIRVHVIGMEPRVPVAA